MENRRTLETGIRSEGFELVLRREQALRESQRQSYEATISSLRKEVRALQGQIHARGLSEGGLIERLVEVAAGTKLAETIAAPLFDRALDAEGTELEPAAGEVEAPKPPKPVYGIVKARVPIETQQAFRRLQAETGKRSAFLLQEALGLLLREYGRSS